MSEYHSLASLHARDIVSLAAVVKGVKPIAELVIPLEAREEFQRFCRLRNLISFEDGPSDSYQTRMTVCTDEAVAELNKQLKETRSHFDRAKRHPKVSGAKKACEELVKALVRLEGAMFDYPEC